jgi:hypothetical protein
MPLTRKQIYLDAESNRRIHRLATATRMSEAEHIRRAVTSYVSRMPEEKRATNPLVTMIGICDAKAGPKDASVHHDTYLYGRKR